MVSCIPNILDVYKKILLDTYQKCTMYIEKIDIKYVSKECDHLFKKSFMLI